MKPCLLLAALATFVASHDLRAKEVYYDLPVQSLEFPEGPLPQVNETAFRAWHLLAVMHPYAVLDGEGDVFVVSTNQWWHPTRPYPDLWIDIHVHQAREITGRLFVLKTDGASLTPVRFKVPAAAAKSETSRRFHEARAAYYRRLLDYSLPGGAWFRHQQQQSLNQLPGRTNAIRGNPEPFNRRPTTGLENSYDLLSGGRAVSENLQLDRVFNVTASSQETIDLTSLTGISVQAMDWKALTKDIKPQLDPLAVCVPADQHGLFFPSFRAMTELMDEADFQGTPVLQLLEPRSEDAKTRSRYQSQLCLDLSELSRRIGPYVIDSAAFTGSDPYLRTGSDVGILYESKNPEVLKAFVMAKQSAALKANAKAVHGELEGVSYDGVVSPDRVVSSYVAALKNVVFISNSLLQLDRMVKTAQGKNLSMASLDEYLFFRDRYKRNDAEETAFLVLTDAAIRRWCGPRWRILSARRTLAAAVMSALQATNLDALVKGRVQPGAIPSASQIPDAGELRMTPDGAVSSVYGSLEFMTPILEIPLSKVRPAEAEAYTQWRNRYQNNWRQYFDPIAVRFSVRPSQISVDLSVMPLIAGSDYRNYVEVARGVKIMPDAADPHTNALLHLALAVNAEARPIAQMGSFIGPVSSAIKTNPLGWLGQSIAVYCDEDSFWQELRSATNAQEWLEREFYRMPIALWCEVKNPLGLGAFLTTIRGMSDSSAPGLLVWQNLEYNGQTYVKIRSALPSDGRIYALFKNLAIYYVVKPESLLLTFNESLLKRAIDRQADRAKLKAEGKSPPASSRPWLGESLCWQGDRQCLEVTQYLGRNDLQATLRELSWNNIPILNEWHRLYPDQDPVQLHEKYWQVKLVCPAGGRYVWNEQWQTMESTACGHPGEPKPIDAQRFILPGITGANFGITFENQGLRAKAIFEREAK